jgi:hypothetical protein
VGNYRGSAKVSGPGVDESVSNTEIGFGFGGGFLINSASNSAFFADVTYHHITFDGDDAATNYLNFTIGALFRFDLFKKDMSDDLQDDLEKVRH